MTATTALIAAVALATGLVVGFGLARGRRIPAPEATVEDASAWDEETRPTLVPFRTPRERGIARALDQAGADEPDQLDALLAELDRKVGEPPSRKG